MIEFKVNESNNKITFLITQDFCSYEYLGFKNNNANLINYDNRHEILELLNSNDIESIRLAFSILSQSDINIHIYYILNFLQNVSVKWQANYIFSNDKTIETSREIIYD